MIVIHNTLNILYFDIKKRIEKKRLTSAFIVKILGDILRLHNSMLLDDD